MLAIRRRLVQTEISCEGVENGSVCHLCDIMLYQYTENVVIVEGVLIVNLGSLLCLFVYKILVNHEMNISSFQMLEKHALSTAAPLEVMK
jgi:hypothetical protein